MPPGTTKNFSENKPQETDPEKPSQENVIAAHEQAEADIQKDPDLTMQSPNDDLDEGESARLGEDKNELA